MTQLESARAGTITPEMQYVATREDLPSDRSDDYCYIRGGLEMSVSAKLGLGVFYQFRQNASSDAVFEFNNHQVGIQAAYHF